MLDISIKIDGKPVNPRNIKNAMESMIINGAVDSVKKSLQGVHCSAHGESPKIKIVGKTLDNLSFEVSACCDELKNKVTRKLK
jgi:hypothetical protein